jgi:hypothetical protein
VPAGEDFASGCDLCGCQPTHRAELLPRITRGFHSAAKIPLGKRDLQNGVLSGGQDSLDNLPNDSRCLAKSVCPMREYSTADKPMRPSINTSRTNFKKINSSEHHLEAS